MAATRIDRTIAKRAMALIARIWSQKMVGESPTVTPCAPSPELSAPVIQAMLPIKMDKATMFIVKRG